MKFVRQSASLVLRASAGGVCARGQRAPSDTDESAYAPSTLAKILGGTARSQNDEAELAALERVVHHHGEFHRPQAPAFGPLSTDHRRLGQQPRPGSLDHGACIFSGDLPELEFEQGGRKYWVMAGLPGGLGFDVYPPGQKLTIYLQTVGFASGTPVAVLTHGEVAHGGHFDDGADGTGTCTTRAWARERAARKPRSRTGTATFTYAGREYSLPLDVSGRHSITPGHVFVRKRRAHGVARVRLER